MTITETAATMAESAIKMGESAAKMDVSALKMDESAATMEESAAKMDESAAKLDESAVKMDESTLKMDETAADLRNLLRQQAAVAGFGSYALRQRDIMNILTEAARVCAIVFSAPFCKIGRYRVDENDLLIEAGYGWQDGVVGHVASPADESSPQGRAFVTGQPSICNSLHEDNDFKLPPFYAVHGIVCLIDVVIKGDERAYGVLEIASDVERDFDPHDIEFLTGFANVLAEAVATSALTSVLQTTIDRMEHLVEEKNRLLEQKNVLAEELQHRVRNNLQVVCTTLSKLLGDTADQAGKRRIKSVERRVCSLARVYDHLHSGEMTRTMDFAFYAKSLCLTLAELLGGTNSGVTLSCESDEIILDLDTVTTLGLVVTELVSNSYEHAFPDGKGSVSVSVRNDGGNAGTATIAVRDSGTGFTPLIESKRHRLGLVRRLIEQLRGTVLLDSAQGTVWTIQFPTTQGHTK